MVLRRQYKIATGKSRKDMNWHNTEVSWQSFREMLKNPRRTSETVEEYHSYSKEKQSEIKDIGGFVGGYLETGRRSKNSVKLRSMLTLDVDFAPQNFWKIFTEKYSCAASIYSTHKHTAKSPRLRLIVPLSRDCDPEEYEAVARKVAEHIGIDYFDDTTYQPSRLMYWPSCPKDGAYVYKEQDGVPLNVDAILAEYVDWHDLSAWPISSRTGETLKRSIKDTQQDPLTKEGMVGYFCRAYSISDAISAFSLPYTKTPGTSNRYTYTNGSTAGGLVVYEDKFAYSNHATDPAGGMLCNAFDLVRIHLFGGLDKDSLATGTRLPSYKKMLEFCTEDGGVLDIIGRERLAEAEADFKNVEPKEKPQDPAKDEPAPPVEDLQEEWPDTPPEENTPQNEAETPQKEDDYEWLQRLSADKRGNYLPTIENFRLILDNDPLLAGKLGGYNIFNFRNEAGGDLPWCRFDSRGTATWTDSDDNALTAYIEKVYGLYSPNKALIALDNYFQAHAFHPVRNYLDPLKWDGKKRLDRLFVEFLGADDNAYTWAVTRKMFVAAVARIYEPGTKFDTMVMLTGAQGIGKSTLIRTMAHGWFSDSLAGIGTKEAYDGLQGVWLIEMAELSAFKKSEVEAVKHFVSKTEDTYRQAYARRTATFPRQCVFFGTTNDKEFLRDQTGNRRYWPVECNEDKKKRSVFSLHSAEINQLWAEAKTYYLQKEPLVLDDDLNQTAIRLQEEHTEQDPWEGIIAKFLDTPVPKNYDLLSVDARQLWNKEHQEGRTNGETIPRQVVSPISIYRECLGYYDKPNAQEVRVINIIMDKQKEWRKCRYTDINYGRQRGFERIPETKKKKIKLNPKLVKQKEEETVDPWA